MSGRGGSGRCCVRKREAKGTCSEPQQEEQQQRTADVTAQVWNELVAMKQKPTKSLGRTALLAAWEDMELLPALLQPPHKKEHEEWKALVEEYVRLFYDLLTATSSSTTATHPGSFRNSFGAAIQDSSAADARLIWDADKGQAEMARRAADRQIRVAEVV